MKLDEAGRQVLRDAVRAVETKSRAEIVVAVRPRSDSYNRGPLLVGAVLGWTFLGFQLFSASYVFSLEAIFLEPVLIGAAAAYLAAAIPGFTRILVSPRKRRLSVERAARATFQERGVGLTRERTGVLLYVSALEREAFVVADKGITDNVAPEIWKATVDRVVALTRNARTARALAQAIHEFAEPLSKALRAREDDVDELPDVAEAVQ